MSKVFTNLVLPMGGNAVVFEGTGWHLFRAGELACGDPSLVIKYLLIQLIEVDGKKLTVSELDAMHIRDIILLQETINLMLSNEYTGS